MRPERSMAMREGKTRYSGHPCRVPSHQGVRYTSTGACVECLNGTAVEKAAFKEVRRIQKIEENLQSPRLFRCFPMPSEYSAPKHYAQLHAMLLNSPVFGRLLMWANAQDKAVYEKEIGAFLDAHTVPGSAQAPSRDPELRLTAKGAVEGSLDAYLAGGWTEQMLIQDKRAEWK